MKVKKLINSHPCKTKDNAIACKEKIFAMSQNKDILYNQKMI